MARALLLLSIILLGSLLCWSQPPFLHIVIVIQENRTPDNLFGSCVIPGADLVATGNQLSLGSNVDVDHGHKTFLAEIGGKYQSKAFAYVQQSDVASYCQLGAQYAFANRMFQTNQGPSTPAHQFLFSGTSAPSDTSDWFESEIAFGGCLSIGLTLVQFIDPAGKENHMGSPCLDPSTMADLLDPAGISWRYYAPSATSMWTAPAAIKHLCVPVKIGFAYNCTGEDWKNMDFNPPDVLDDIANNNLAAVSWVVPSAPYSDHPGYGTGGPAWVASIVNAIGQSAYWQSTAVIVLWDDWGGWYDHVPPLQNSTGWCPSYCYGFRVPMLVISAYTPTGYVDNNTHDFGSILRFVESNFGLGLIGPGTYADSYSDNLAEFFTAGQQEFKSIRGARKAAYFKAQPLKDPDDE